MISELCERRKIYTDIRCRRPRGHSGLHAAADQVWVDSSAEPELELKQKLEVAEAKLERVRKLHDGWKADAPDEAVLEIFLGRLLEILDDGAD